MSQFRNICSKMLDKSKTGLSNTIYAFQERRKLKKHVKKMPQLSPEQKKAVKDFWKPYCKVSTDWARYYTYVTGKFDPRYLPNDLPLRIVDQHFNRWKMVGFTDKNYYSLIFPGFNQPKTVVRKMGNLLFDSAYRQINLQRAMELLAEQPEVIAKVAFQSAGGVGVRIYDTKAEAQELKCLLQDSKKDHLIVQGIVKQHGELAKMHPHSLNTVRIYTIMLEDGVHILSASLRMGANGSRIDNVSSNAGIIAGIKDNGELMDRAYFDLFSGKTTDKHPNGMPLSEIKVPAFAKMKEAVTRAAQYCGYFRLIGWDLTVNESEDVVIIEANMFTGEMNPIQFLHGPFFGDLTERVLAEVYGRKNK